jgi:MFS family permease
MSGQTPGSPRKGSLGGLRAAALAGSTIEWFDFFIYGTAAALVFGKLFFPTASPLVGTLLAFSTFWAGFLARPLGGLVFGHVGDKFGRKPATVICMATMGVATFAIGAMPSAESIGVLAPILLVLLRFVQGIAVGGQWGGVILMLTERAGSGKRGFAGIFGQLGVPLGLALGNAAFLVMTSLTDDEAFVAWGWRVPFLVSLLLIPIAYYIHTRIEDSPTFQELKREHEAGAEPVVKAPLTSVLRRHPKQILFGAGLLFGCNAFFYASVTGLISYGSTVLQLDRGTLLLCVMVYVIPGSLTIIGASILSDRYGRRPVMIAGGVLMLLWGFPFFLLVDTASYGLITLAVAVAAVGANLIFGPYAAYLTELFSPDVRYSGMSVAYQLSSVIVSGGTPVLMTGLVAATGSSTPVAAFLAAMGAVSLGSALVLGETNTDTRARTPERVTATEVS